MQIDMQSKKKYIHRNLYKVLLLTVLMLKSIVAVPTSRQQVKEDETDLDLPIGDARKCQTVKNVDIERFGVLPGLGWDNLRNLEAGLVVSYKYTECKETDDGVYLIPDNVFTIPIKNSKVESFAQIIDNWNSASSLTANSINIGAGVSLSKYGISGMFSRDHEELRSKQIEDKSSTFRAQLRYPRYEAKLQPDAELSPQFKNRLLSIAVKIELNQTSQAEYEAQLLVRDFGTHVLTSVTAGAALVKEDYLSNDMISNSKATKKSYLAAASVSFLSIFKISSSFGITSQADRRDAYSSATTYSVTRAIGGPMYDPESSNLSAWVKGIEKNLVPLDRAGEPLSSLVKQQLLPELPLSTIDALEKVVQGSIELYYEMNTYRGCTKLDDPNFSVSANVEDGSCGTKPTHLRFGGVYQTCTVYGSTYYHNPCDGLRQVNPKTGTYSCPPFYTAVLIQTFYKRVVTETETNCRGCGFLWLSTCCDTKHIVATATYSAYWCAATASAQPYSGYFFGGFYTPTQDNPLTGSTTCPPSFYPRRFLTDISLCLSEHSTQRAIPFGGFFSCKSGNPLAVLEAKTGLDRFMSRSNDSSTSYPMRCPENFNQLLATSDSDCSIYYCASTRTLTNLTITPIKRPPFKSKPDNVYTHDEKYMFNPETLMWMKNEEASDFEKQESKEANASKDTSAVTLTFTCLLVTASLL
nr:macrophage-expressed gene 1 protein-like [Biomphalaria glabrata]